MINTFGEYLSNKRKQKEMSLRMLAKELDISPTYLSDVENNRRNALSYEKLQKIIEVLGLEADEQKDLYDLAGKSKDTIPADVEEYIKENTQVITLLRQIQQGKHKNLLKEQKEDGEDKKK